MPNAQHMFNWLRFSESPRAHSPELKENSCGNDTETLGSETWTRMRAKIIPMTQASCSEC